MLSLDLDGLPAVRHCSTMDQSIPLLAQKNDVGEVKTIKNENFLIHREIKLNFGHLKRKNGNLCQNKETANELFIFGHSRIIRGIKRFGLLEETRIISIPVNRNDSERPEMCHLHEEKRFKNRKAFSY